MVLKTKLVKNISDECSHHGLLFLINMSKRLWQKIISGMKLSLEDLIDESADSMEKSYHLKIYILVLGCLFCNVI